MPGCPLDTESGSVNVCAVSAAAQGVGAVLLTPSLLARE